MKTKYSANVNVTLTIPVEIDGECYNEKEAHDKALSVVHKKLDGCNLLSKTEVE